MPDRIDFSIIIPTHNRPHPLALCLEAMGNMDYSRALFEVIVIDDGSTPPIEPIALSFSDQLDVKVWHQENRGPASARNRGAMKAAGRYLAFTDDDCAPRTDWLRTLRTGFASWPDAMIGGRTVNAFPDNIYSTASQILIDYLYRYYNTDPDNAVFLASNNIAIGANHFRLLGGFDPGFPFAAAEDRDLCDRCRLFGLKLVYAPDAVVFHKHDLRLGTFWRQHFRYGSGAFRFHKIRSRRIHAALKLEEFNFYRELLQYPFVNTRGRQALFISALLSLSQVGNAFGFFWQFCNEPRRRCRRKS